MAKLSMFLILSAAFLTSCLSGNRSYVPPTTTPSNTSFRIIDQPRDVVWAKLVAELGKNFFVINNIDKSSGLINMSYSGDPTKYVDCGWISSSVKNARGERDYHFQAASPYEQYELADGMTLYYIERRISLDGRINVVLEATDQAKTRVTVNVRYTLEKDVTIQDAAHQHLPQTLSDHVAFNSGQTGSFSMGNGQPRCVPTGALEALVLKALDAP